MNNISLEIKHDTANEIVAVLEALKNMGEPSPVNQEEVDALMTEMEAAVLEKKLDVTQAALNGRLRALRNWYAEYKKRPSQGGGGSDKDLRRAVNKLTEHIYALRKGVPATTLRRLVGVMDRMVASYHTKTK